MCLGIPGRVIEVGSDPDLLMGKVDFGGVAREVCLAYVPDVRVDDYVIVHVGFALSKIVKRHGGEITVKSELGRGTSFRVRVPVSEPSVAVAPELGGASDWRRSSPGHQDG